jgi:hypothetical protein
MLILYTGLKSSGDDDEVVVVSTCMTLVHSI